jgi:hypothetical protein
MNMPEGALLHTIADAAAIATFVIAAVAAGYGVRDYVGLKYKKRKRLEDYLKREKEKKQQTGKGHTMFTALHVARYAKISVEEAMRLSFDNPRIAVRVKKNPTGYAEALLFEYLAPGEKDTAADEVEVPVAA